MATSTAPLGTFIKFHQFAKLEDKDGEQPTVWGVATWERPDSDQEVCDYDTAKPVYQAWSSKAFKRTNGAGQEPSLGNVRLQHGSDVGGKATKLEFRDDDKEIWLGSEPINDEVHTALKKGFYTGYSQGGSYAWRACDKCETPMSMQQGDNWCNKCNKFVTVRYGLKRLAEVSYVDSPAIGEGFEHVKADGSCEILKFKKKENPVSKDAKTKRVAGEDLPASAFAYVGDPEKTDTWKLPIKFSTDAKTKRHIRNALARFEQTQGIPEDKKEEVKAKIHAAATAHGVEVSDVKSKSDKIRVLFKAQIDARAESKGFQKGLYAVGRMAELMETLACLYEQALWERDMEGDDSEVPEELQEHLEGLVETFISMATEEARELAARTDKTEKGAANTMKTTEELIAEFEKAAKKSLAHHFAKSAAHHEKMADHHEALAEHHEQMAEHHKSAHEKMSKRDANEGAEGEARGSNNEMNEATVTFHKAAQKEHVGLAAKHMKCAKAHDGHAEHCAKMSESHDEEESKKVMKAEKDAYKAEKDAEPTAPVVKAEADDFISRATKQAQENLMKNPDFIKELEAAQRQALLGKVAAASAEALAKETITPTNVTIVPRNGKTGTDDAFKFANDSREASPSPF